MLAGLAFQPAVSTNAIKKEELEPKKYLFQTIIDITKNPDVKNFFNNIEPNDIQAFCIEDFHRAFYNKTHRYRCAIKFMYQLCKTGFLAFLKCPEQNLI